MSQAHEETRAAARVAVIDDDVSTRIMLREVLEPAGFEVLEAEGGQAGLQLIEQQRPSIVLLDIVMPGMDGFETLERLRAQADGSQCPVVMITGLNDEAAIERAYDLGATDFITKPINWALLRHRLRYLIRAHRPTGQPS